MRFVPTDVADCTVVEMDRYFDDRGFFQEIYQADNYLDLPIKFVPQQMNCSLSKKNVLRGIHYAEYAKLITCVSGRIWDMVVDLRSDSPTFLKHIGVELSDDNPKQVYVPAGCGHGFVALEDNSKVIYSTDGLYAKLGELTVMYNEPNLNIPWPGKDHIISERDKGGNPLWAFQLCVEAEMNYVQNDHFQDVWLKTFSPEEQAEWRKKFPKE